MFGQANRKSKELSAY